MSNQVKAILSFSECIVQSVWFSLEYLVMQSQAAKTRKREILTLYALN